MSREQQKYIYVGDGHNLPPRPALGFMIAALAEAYFCAWVTGRALIVDWRDTVYSCDPRVNLFDKLFEINRDVLGIELITEDIDNIIRNKSIFMVDKKYHSKNISNHDQLDGNYWTRYWKKNELKNRIRCLFNSAKDGTGLFDLTNIFPKKQNKAREYTNIPLLYQEEDIIWLDYIASILPFPNLYHEKFDEFISHLKLRPPFREELNGFKRDHFFGKNVLGLHIRHGNGEKGDFENKNRQIANMNEYLDMVCQNIEDLNFDHDERFAIFLCTDSDLIVSEMRKRFPDLITREQWRPEIGAGISFELGQDCPDGEIVNAANAAIDMFLLASCNHIATTEPVSWFSKVAARRMIGGSRLHPLKSLSNAVFPCAALPSAIANKVSEETRVSSGEAGCLVYGPYLKLAGAGRRYCVEFTYLTNGRAPDRVGEFDVTISRRNGDGEQCDFVTLEKTVLQATSGSKKTMRLKIDTSGRAGWFLETRVHVERGVELQAFQVHTRLLEDDLSELAA